MPDTRTVKQLFAEAVRMQSAEDFDQAQVLLRRVLALEPHHPDALNNLGLIAYRAHCYPEAIDLIGRALARAPGRAAFHNNLGVLYSVSGRRREAIEPFTRAVAGAPANAAFRCNLGNALKECGDFARALEEFRAAIDLDSRYGEAHFGASLCLLALGRSGEAWPEYRWRVAAGGLQVPRAGALYDGLRERLGAELPTNVRDERLLILGEQGLGDQLFFLRFAPILRSIGTRLDFFTAEKQLASLVARSDAIERVYTEPAQVPQAGHRILVGDLPLAAGTVSGDAPPPLTIDPDAASLAAARQRLAHAGPPPYLGVTWQAGNPPAAGRPEALRKSVPVNALARAMMSWRGTVIILQRHPRSGEIDEFTRTSRLRVHDGSDLNDDLAAMHAVLALLDEYAGVSNTNLHLRAAAGRTARVLVAFPPEWRWRADGDQSPWFPGFRLYREDENHGWQPALARLAADLTPPKRARAATRPSRVQVRPTRRRR